MMTKHTNGADLVLAALEQAERSQSCGAGKAGVAETTFRRKLAGDSEFTMTELARLSAALHIPLRNLIPYDVDAVAA